MAVGHLCPMQHKYAVQQRITRIKFCVFANTRKGTRADNSTMSTLKGKSTSTSAINTVSDDVNLTIKSQTSPIAFDEMEGAIEEGLGGTSELPPHEGRADSEQSEQFEDLTFTI